QVFMQGQEFTPEDARITGLVVKALVIGLPAYVLIKVLTPNFFARKDTRTPVITAAIALGVTVTLNFGFIFGLRLGVVGLALAGAVGAWVNIALLTGLLARRGFFILPGRVLGRIARIALASSVMGAGLWFLMPSIEPWVTGSLLQKALGVAAILAVGAVTYGVAAILLGVLDKASVQRLMRRGA
ncbi:MAG: lipid II flippase MurJ, partial [Pseudomonadota bacterium]